MNAAGRRRIYAVMLPAAVFQSVIFGGAYGTGREVAEFISAYGPIGGLFALAAVAVAFAIVLTLSFELARVLAAYDYRSFLRLLVGKGWVVYEFLLAISIPLVLAVNGSAAAAIMQNHFHLPAIFGVVITFMVVIIISYLGRSAVEKSLFVLAIGLVLVLCITGAAAISAGADRIHAAFASFEALPGWPRSALQYSLYNVALVPVILYAAHELRSTGESVACGIAAGIAGIFPALVFHVTFMSAYPQIIDEPIPVYTVLGELTSPFLFWIYVVVLFLMIVSTVIGLLHGLNERIDAWNYDRLGKPATPIIRAVTVALAMVISLFLSTLGITTLIADGYGTLAWVFLAVFVLPLIVRSPILLSRKKTVR